MKPAIWKRALLLLFVFGMLFMIAPAGAQTGGPYELSWLTIDGGGASTGSGAASGGAYSLRNSIGQPEPAKAAGGAYALQGGFLVKSYYTLLLPVTMR
jgi:hypothetical protein